MDAEHPQASTVPQPRSPQAVLGRPVVSRLRVQLLLVFVTSIAWGYAWGLPAIEDDKFWWIPKGLVVAERGPTLMPDGALPAALLPPGTPPPPQWTGGLPDYAHPPLFFLYLGAFFAVLGPGMRTTHLALLPLALLAVLGTARLSRRLAGEAAALGAGALLALTPVVMGQLARADLDLGLLAMTPWALDALIARRRLRFALLAASATLVKEPGVLLVVPALVQAIQGPRRMRIGALASASAPLLALGGWAVYHWSQTHWGLAPPERLAPDLAGRLQDTLAVARFLLLEQGRAVLAALAVLALFRAPGWYRGPAGVLVAHVAIHVLFFGNVNFLGGDPLRTAGSHLRYLVPALPALVALGAAAVEACRLPALVAGSAWLLTTLLAALDWHGPPDGGVERNLYQVDLARAQARIASALSAGLEAGVPVWVGSYAYLDYASPAVGTPGGLIRGLEVYGQGTDPASIPVGAYVLESSHGEPLGRLSQELELVPVTRVKVHRAWVQVHRVAGTRRTNPP